jgi:hypothetical protein
MTRKMGQISRNKDDGLVDIREITSNTCIVVRVRSSFIRSRRRFERSGLGVSPRQNTHSKANGREGTRQAMYLRQRALSWREIQPHPSLRPAGLANALAFVCMVRPYH